MTPNIKKYILLFTALLFTSCATTGTQNRVVYQKSHNYNHKPYLELKFKRKIEREHDV